jgi:signal transduction histidine kinase
MLAPMARGGSQGRGPAVVVVLLAMTFLVVAYLSMRAYAASTYHRATAQRVVRDWTRVAVDELARRAEAQAGFYGTYPVLLAMAESVAPLSPPELVAAAATPESRRNAALVRATFRYLPASDTLLQAPALDAEVAAWLRTEMARIAAAPPPPGERRPLHPPRQGSQPWVYVLPPSGDRVDGFEVDAAGLPAFFELALRAGPLVPASLAEGRVTNESLALRVTRGNGEELWRSGPPLAAERTVLRRPESGLLAGLELEAALAAEVEPLIVFGGVPRPALALYLAPLALAAGLLLTAVLQLRREQALARLRSEFVASVSHELRTPLTQIRMFAETLLLERVRSPDEGRRALAVIDREARRLTHLVENVLQFSRAERGTLALAPRALDLVELARETLAACAPLAAARGARVTGDLPERALVLADEDALRQVLLNLLDNALKYGPQGQEVTVSVEPARPGRPAVRLTVDDQGPGIPPRERRRVFRRYQRLERERARAIAGTGIGLAVVRDLVERHGGRVWVEDGPRGGARFVVELAGGAG